MVRLDYLLHGTTSLVNHGFKGVKMKSCCWSWSGKRGWQWKRTFLLKLLQLIALNLTSFQQLTTASLPARGAAMCHWVFCLQTGTTHVSLKSTAVAAFDLLLNWPRCCDVTTSDCHYVRTGTNCGSSARGWCYRKICSIWMEGGVWYLSSDLIAARERRHVLRTHVSSSLEEIRDGRCHLWPQVCLGGKSSTNHGV